MTGARPNPPRLTWTDHTRQFVDEVRARGRANDRAEPSRADWLLTLLRADHPYLSSHLIREVAGSTVLSALVADTEAVERGGDAWLTESVAQFVREEVEPVARELGHGYIGTEHMLLTFSRAPGPTGDRLREARVTWERLRTAFESIEWGTPPR
jgi:hypothetical protein